MYLKALEMQGFKSFPDKTVLEFDAGMTAVVGPNGSGKSNISDAVMWVLGEQSAKTLRSAKMEDVIFSGTQSRRPMGYAEVTLRLDNADRTLDPTLDEITVTRRYYRSGESEYRLNGQAVRLKDIHELFMDTGLGRDGYSMVGQGRIESIVSARSVDRREIFEEAAGIAHYRFRRSDALRRLEQSEENLVRIRDITGELEGRLAPLEKQCEKAKKFLALSDERRDLEIGLWLHALDRSTELLRRQSEKLDITKSQYDTAVEASESLFREAQTAQERFGHLTAEIEQLQRAVAETEQAARDAEAEANLAETHRQHNEDSAVRIRRELAEGQLSDREMQEKIAAARQTVARIGEELQALRERLSETASEAGRLAEEENRLQARMLEKNAQIAAVEAELARRRIASTSAESAVTEIRARLAAIEGEYKEKKADIERFDAQIARCGAEIKRIGLEMESAENTLSGYEMKMRGRQQKVDEAVRKVQDAEVLCASLLSRRRMLEETERNMEGYQGSVKAVVGEAGKGGLGGIRGPVSRLISTEEKYAAAVETALGAAVQNIVTETENDAKQAMLFLKRTNGGRATFLPMSAIRARTLSESGLDACPGFLAVASDIVTCDPQYREIAVNLLGRTVIAETIDDAITIARKYGHRFKIVTLDGQVINPGGSMTGGSGIRSSGFITRRGEIERLSRRLKDAEEEQKTVREETERLRRDAEKTRQEQEGLRAELFRLREASARSEEQLLAAKNARETAAAAVAAFDEERAGAQSRLTSLDDDSERSAGEIARLETSRRELSDEGELLAKEHERLLEQKERLSACSARLQVEEAEKTALLSAAEENARTFSLQKDNLAEKAKALETELSELEKDNDRLAAELTACRERAEQSRNRKQELRRSAEDTVKKRESVEQEISMLRVREREKNAEKENLAAETVRLEEKKASLEKERDDTEKKLYEEYNLTRREARALDIRLDNLTEASTRLADIRRKIKALGSVNVGAIDEYKEVSERYGFLSGQLKDIEDSKQELLKLVNDLTEKMSAQFAERFRLISERFSETFSLLFGGGRGELALEDPSDLLECGIEIKAQPPGKNVKSISLLSGGEKGLCAIALLFAILKVNPAPFCIFDEVEAALDDVNVTKFAAFVREMSVNTQFILITHRRGSMEAADVLYGVTMQEHGVSKLLELRTADMAKRLGIEE